MADFSKQINFTDINMSELCKKVITDTYIIIDLRLGVSKPIKYHNENGFTLAELVFLMSRQYQYEICSNMHEDSYNDLNFIPYKFKSGDDYDRNNLMYGDFIKWESFKYDEKDLPGANRLFHYFKYYPTTHVLDPCSSS